MTKIDNRRDPLAVSRLSMTLLIVLLAWPVLKGAEFNPGALFGAVFWRLFCRRKPALNF